MTNYQHVKAELKFLANQAKENFKTDKPAIRQIINDNTYFLSKSFNLSEYKTNLLHNYACTLHPKE